MGIADCERRGKRLHGRARRSARLRVCLRVREGALVALRVYGIPAERVLLISALFGLALFVSTLPGLLAWLAQPMLAGKPGAG